MDFLPLYQIRDKMLLVDFPDAFIKIITVSNEHCSVAYCAFHCVTYITHWIHD